MQEFATGMRYFAICSPLVASKTIVVLFGFTRSVVSVFGRHVAMFGFWSDNRSRMPELVECVLCVLFCPRVRCSGRYCYGEVKMRFVRLSTCYCVLIEFLAKIVFDLLFLSMR